MSANNENLKPNKIIAVDFDGTCVAHEYPEIGKDIGAAPVLRSLVRAGNKIILWTMRSGRELKAAVEWFEQNKIELWGVNSNPEQSWSSSPKAYRFLVFRPTKKERPRQRQARLLGNRRNLRRSRLIAL